VGKVIGKKSGQTVQVDKEVRFMTLVSLYISGGFTVPALAKLMLEEAQILRSTMDTDQLSETEIREAIGDAIGADERTAAVEAVAAEAAEYKFPDLVRVLEIHSVDTTDARMIAGLIGTNPAAEIRPAPQIQPQEVPRVPAHTAKSKDITKIKRRIDYVTPKVTKIPKEFREGPLVVSARAPPQAITDDEMMGYLEEYVVDVLYEDTAPHMEDGKAVLLATEIEGSHASSVYHATISYYARAIATRNAIPFNQVRKALVEATNPNSEGKPWSDTFVVSTGERTDEQAEEEPDLFAGQTQDID